MDKGANFEKELWFDMGKCMWRKHHSVLQDHLKYIRNDIVKPSQVRIICYYERVKEIHNLEKYLPPPSKKGKIFEAASWKVYNK